MTTISSFVCALALSASASDEPKAPAWDVQAPPGPAQDFAIDVREGTWMNVDVSPDGTEICFDLLGDLYTLPIAGGEARAVQSGVAWQMQPRYSPDGAWIAFTSDAGGGDNVWVAKRDGSGARQVTKESFRLLNSPTWSPDGQWIAAHKHFTSRRSLGAGEIWLYHISGGEGLQLTTRANEQKDLGEPAFSPDGRNVYFSFDATGGDSFEYSKDSTAGIYAIDRLDRDTGERARVADGPGGACRPTPSHDGKRLAFVRRDDFVTTLFVMDLASGEARPIYAPLERDMQETWAIHGVYPAFAWLPGDREIVLYAQGRVRRVDVQKKTAREIPFHVQGTRRVEDAVRFAVDVAPAEFAVKALRSVAVAPAGDQVAYQALGHVWLRALPEGAPRRMAAVDERFEFAPSFSRDGGRVVFTKWTDEKLGTVVVRELATGVERELTSEPGHYVEPVFTPDGAQVVYRKATGGGLVSPLWSREPGIYRVSAEGGAPVLVTKKGMRPQFGSDGARVYLTTEEERKDADHRTLWSVDLDGGDERVHLASEWATQFAISPDGKWVAFSERWNAYLAPFEATGREVAIGPETKAYPVARLTRDAGENLQFSADSRRVHWSLGPELYERDLKDAFAFLAGAPEKLPAAPESGRNISFTAKRPVIEGSVALVGARVVTMKGDEVIEDGVVVVNGDRIAAVGRRADVTIPADARVIDAAGLTVIPGIIDVHAHGPQAVNGVTPQHNWASHANLAFGVTTIHDPSHDTNSIFAASELQEAGLVLAPRTFSTGTIVYGAQGDFKAPIESLDDARSHLRRLKAVGAFSVKSYNQPRRDQRQQVIQAARELEMMVVPEGGSLLQHNLTMVVDGHTGVEHSLPVEKVYADVQQLWGPSKTGYTPTLIVGYGGIWGENYWYQHSDVWRDERLTAFVPKFVVEPRSRRRTMAPDEDQNILRSSGIVKSLIDAGARAQLGAHGQLAGLGAHWELWLLKQSGITNLQALRCATLSGAQYLGLDRDLGSIEAGKLADLVVMEKNPLEDIRGSESIRWTMQGGRLYDARTLAPADGRAGAAPTYFWRSMQSAMPGQTATEACAGCGG
jgi:Tol biopolymer transport system component/imidazolonepropionase-like amidohydrolase